MATIPDTHTIALHFSGRAPEVLATYRAILAAADQLGRFEEDVKKTSIHLTRKTAFAAVTTQRMALILTLKASADIQSERIVKHQQVAPHRWHLDVRLERPVQVDRELIGWLRHAYDLAG